MSKYIGLDLGTTTIGVAYSDALGFVHGLETFRFEPNAYSKAREKVHQVVAQLGIKNLVLGLPINMDGTEGPRAEKTRAFGDKLAALTSIPVEYIDERLTSVEAEEILISAGMRREKRKEVIDKVAATLILESYLKK